VDTETTRLFDLELKYWGVATEDYYKSKMPKKLVDLLESAPQIETDSDKQ